MLETGPVWFSRNDVRIPGDSGTRFDMLELTDNGPEAFDVAFKGTYELGSGWRLGGGYRLLERGADTDDVYNFACLHYAVASLEYHF